MKRNPTNTLSPFTDTLQLFIRSMTANNHNSNTVIAYSTDIRQFLAYLGETDSTVIHPNQVERNRIIEYLAHLSDLGRTGVTRARKLNAIREYFAFLTVEAVIWQSPASTIAMPKEEKNKKLIFGRMNTIICLRLQGTIPAILPSFKSSSKMVSGCLNLSPSGLMTLT